MWQFLCWPAEGNSCWMFAIAIEVPRLGFIYDLAGCWVCFFTLYKQTKNGERNNLYNKISVKSTIIFKCDKCVFINNAYMCVCVHVLRLNDFLFPIISACCSTRNQCENINNKFCSVKLHLASIACVCTHQQIINENLY